MFAIPSKLTFLAVAGIAGAAFLCPVCEQVVAPAEAQSAVQGTQAPDSATVRLHISGMTCSACPTTARLALRRVPGVYSATVALDDSLGVVRYNPRQASPQQIAAHLTRLTGFGAVILPDSNRAGRRTRGS